MLYRDSGNVKRVAVLPLAIVSEMFILQKFKTCIKKAEGSLTIYLKFTTVLKFYRSRAALGVNFYLYGGISAFEISRLRVRISRCFSCKLA